MQGAGRYSGRYTSRDEDSDTRPNTGWGTGQGASRDTVRDTLETLTPVKSEALFDRLAKEVSKWRIRELDTLPEVKNEALDDKVAEKLAEVKVATLLTLLSEIKNEVLMNTSIGRNSGLKIRRCAWQQIGSRPKKDAYLDS